MSQRDNGKFQRKISELEKFIRSVLESPMNQNVKRKVMESLYSYKAKLIADSGKREGRKTNRTRNENDDS